VCALFDFVAMVRRLLPRARVMSFAPAPALLDLRARPLTDLRVSVTDRCNFRCPYCMPRKAFGREHEFLPRSALLSFEEIALLVSCFAELGVRKVRLTGGEPLLRRDLPRLVSMLRAIPQLEIALTTNGSLLSSQADALAQAGLDRVTVSLDALDAATFSRMSDSTLSPQQVLSGIDTARRAGLPIKINCVVQRGVNEHAVLELAERFRGSGVTVRFIEFMDVGNHNHWQGAHVVTAAEIVSRIDAHWPLSPVAAQRPNDVAQRYRYRDGAGELGVIASVSAPFCGDCSRARISAEGVLYTCLFAQRGRDLRAIVRDPAFELPVLRDTIRQVWTARDDRYSEQRGLVRLRRKVDMSYIGG
jgi:cyclic pyranopterin phosphate synthase